MKKQSFFRFFTLCFVYSLHIPFAIAMESDKQYCPSLDTLLQISQKYETPEIVVCAQESYSTKRALTSQEMLPQLEKNNPFLELLDPNLEKDLEISPPTQPQEQTQWLINLLGGSRETLPSRLHELAETLSVQAKILNAFVKLNISYQAWQKIADTCKTLCSSSQNDTAPLLVYSFHDGDQPLGHYHVYSPEVLVMILLIRHFYPEHLLFSIDEFPQQIIACFQTSPLEPARSFGELVSLVQQSSAQKLICGNHYLPKSHEMVASIMMTYQTKLFSLNFLCAVYNLAFPKSSLQLPPQKSSLNVNKNLQPFLCFLTDALALWSLYDHTLMQQNANGTFTDRLTFEDQQYHYALNELCRHYQAQEKKLEALYQCAKKRLFDLWKSKKGSAKNSFAQQFLKVHTQEALPKSLLEQLEPKEVLQVKLAYNGKYQSQIAPQDVIDSIVFQIHMLNKQLSETFSSADQKTSVKPTSAKTKGKKRKKQRSSQNALKQKPILEDVEEKRQKELFPEQKKQPIPQQEPEQKENTITKKQKEKPLAIEHENQDPAILEDTPTHVTINDISNNCKIYLYKLPQKEAFPSFRFSYNQRVQDWFSNEKKALIKQGYTTLGHENYREPEHHDRIIAIHSFSMVVDQYLSAYGHQTFWQHPKQQERQVLNICIPGAICFKDHSENGFFVYGFYKNQKKQNVCYHRNFTQKTQNDFLAFTLQQGRAALQKELNDSLPENGNDETEEAHA